MRYRFPDDLSVDFFRSGLRVGHDVISCAPDERNFDGETAGAYKYARSILDGLDEEDVIAILHFADVVVDHALVDTITLDNDGTLMPLTRDLLPCVRPTDLLPVLITLLEKDNFMLQDINGSQIHVSGERLCCAYALTQVFHSCFGPEGSFYASEAAKAHAMARLLAGRGSVFSEVLANRFAKIQAERGANTRWERLGSVKKLAFARRAEMPELTRAEAIRRMVPEIKAAAEAAGERLPGQETEKTIERWFRKEGIK